MILMIDNYDSFTYNLVRYCEELGVEITVRKNDEITVEWIQNLAPDGILISPGPGAPQEAGICLEVVRSLGGTIPIFGICLGHQIICEAFGGHVVRAKKVVHGYTSNVYHSDTGIFAGLPQGYDVTRYHSLVAELSTFPDVLEITAWTLDTDKCFDEIMALKHKHHEIYGVQFHPEALLTQHGHQLLGAFFKAQCIDTHQQIYNERG